MEISDNTRETLSDVLVDALPAGQVFKYYHISTPPTSCPALYSPLPARQPERTFCSSHALVVTIPAARSPKPSSNPQPSSTAASAKDSYVAIFALEVQIYTTSTLTTLFVSKADSTGFADLLNTSQYPESPLKLWTNTFISFLVRRHHRSDRKLVVSLFARAQGQYLFPGSVENGKKHVLDDRQLVKWWCKTLHPVLREYGSDTETESNHNKGRTQNASTDVRDASKIHSQAYLVVPGHDKYETKAFFPPSACTASQDPSAKRWRYGHPLREIAHQPNAPPRCLVPHFPDDPKSRFLADLDEELPDVSASQATSTESPSKRGNGVWKSVKNLDQFWDMMAFRQECGAGRLTGFLWILFTPASLEDQDDEGSEPTSPSLRPVASQKRKREEMRDRKSKPLDLSKATSSRQRKRPRLSDPVIPRSPRVKHNPPTAGANAQSTLPERTRDYFWPHVTRGSLVLNQKAYSRAHDILLRLDFANLDLARGSTATWIHEAGIIGSMGDKDWGIEITGTRPAFSKSNLRNGSTKASEKFANADTNGNATGSPSSLSNGGINTLGAGLMRKKAKQDESPSTAESKTGNAVSLLNSGLIRKKAKS